MSKSAFKVYSTIKCNSKWNCECLVSDNCKSLVSDYPFNSRDIYTTPNKINGLLTRYEPEDATKKQEFRLFESFTTFYNYLGTIDNTERCYHEVIIGNMPQKVKIDIDIDKRPSSEVLLEIEYKISPIIRNVFYNMYYDQIAELSIIHGFDISSPNIVDTCITFSNSREISATLPNDNTGEHINKAGMHIIVKNFMVANNLEAKEFTRRLLNALPENIKADNVVLNKSIDAQVNKVIQNLRLIGCHKPYQYNRIKTLRHLDKDKPIDSCITQGGVYVLHPIAGNEKFKTVADGVGETAHNCDLNSSECDIVEKCDKWIYEDTNEKDAHSFRNIVVLDKNTTIVNYDRLTSSYCSLCKRAHDNDNTLIFYINMNDVGNRTNPINIRRSCRKYDEDYKANKKR